MPLPLRPISNSGRTLVSVFVAIALAVVAVLSIPPVRTFRRRAMVDAHLARGATTDGPGIWTGTVRGPEGRVTPTGVPVAAWRHAVDTGGKYHVRRCQGGALDQVALAIDGRSMSVDPALIERTRWDRETSSQYPDALRNCDARGTYEESRLEANAVVTVIACGGPAGLVPCSDGVDTVLVGAVDAKALRRLPFDDDGGGRLAAYVVTFVTVALLAYFASRFVVVARRKPAGDEDLDDIHMRGIS